MQFWQNAELDPGKAALNGFKTALRGRIAIELVEKWGTVAGKIDGEDKAGRAILDVMTPEDVVERACTMADLLITQLEVRDWIRPVESTAEEIAARVGRFDKIRQEAQFPRLAEKPEVPA